MDNKCPFCGNELVNGICEKCLKNEISNDEKKGNKLLPLLQISSLLFTVIIFITIVLVRMHFLTFKSGSLGETFYNIETILIIPIYCFSLILSIISLTNNKSNDEKTKTRSIIGIIILGIIPVLFAAVMFMEGSNKSNDLCGEDDWDCKISQKHP